IDHRDLEAMVGGMEGGGVATGTGADDQELDLFNYVRHLSPPITIMGASACEDVNHPDETNNEHDRRVKKNTPERQADYKPKNSDEHHSAAIYCPAIFPNKVLAG